jgi:hypothetical protein
VLLPDDIYHMIKKSTAHRGMQAKQAQGGAQGCRNRAPEPVD